MRGSLRSTPPKAARECRENRPPPLRQDVNRHYTHLHVTALRESFADRRFLVAALALNL
jgi:hypothetical protein